MANLTILAAVLFVTLLSLAEASTYTTITTTVVEDDDTGGSTAQRCQQKMQMRQLSQCSRYVTQRRPQELSIVNPSTEEHLQECCEELRTISDPMCRCESIRMMVTQKQQERQMQGQERQMMTQKAKTLPGKCDMEPRECRMETVWF